MSTQSGHKHKGFRSIKEESGLKKKRLVTADMHLGQLMRKFPKVEDVLYPYVSRSDMVYEDMDFTIEEFSDISGGDLEQILDDINQAVKL